MTYLLLCKFKEFITMKKFGHVSVAIRIRLKRLPVGEKVDYRLLLVVKKCIIGVAPRHLSDL